MSRALSRASTSWDDIFDVVVIGSGMAGLSAAIAAADHGMSAIVIEKADLVGGGTAYSSGLVWVGNNAIGRREGWDDSLHDTIAYLRFLAAGFEVEENLLALAERGPEALDFFLAAGIPFQLCNVPDHYHDRVPGSKSGGRTLEVALVSGYELSEWREKIVPSPYFLVPATCEEAIQKGGRGDRRNWDPALIEERRRADMRACGPGLVVHLLKNVLARGVPIRTATAAKQLVVEEGVVTGIVVEFAGRQARISARRGVVIASGGYEANPKLVRDYETLPEWESMFPDSLTGDGLILGSEIGAAVRTVPNLTVVLGYRIPSASGSRTQFRVAGTVELGRPHTLVVNRQGERFGDESYFQVVVNEMRRFDVWQHSFPNLPCYLLFDQSYADKYPFAGVQAGGAIPDWVDRADTALDLAGKLGIDGARLQATLDRFNSHARRGTDEDFHRGASAWANAHTGDRTHEPNANLGPLERAPYYGVRLVPAGVSSAGLLTSSDGQVMHVRGHPMPGLYASGNAAASVDFGVGFQAGFTLARGMTFSYLAVQHMLGR